MTREEQDAELNTAYSRIVKEALAYKENGMSKEERNYFQAQVDELEELAKISAPRINTGASLAQIL